MALDALNAVTIFVGLLQVAYGVYKKCNPSSYVDQLQNCIVAAWKDTAKQQQWQNISVPKTFSSLNKSLWRIEDLQQTVTEELNKLSQEDVNCFISNFIDNFCKDENEELHRNLMTRFLLNNLKNPNLPSLGSPSYILTPNAPCWKNEHLKDIADFVKNLCQELQNNKLHICLTGMGGIGKTEILNKIYNYYTDNPNIHFGHIALLS
jgi:DNA replication protein DnaC